jgi:hypothetical protein
VPEELLHLDGVPAAAEEHRRARVAERVKANPVADASGATRGLERPTHEVRGVDARAVGRREDELVALQDAENRRPQARDLQSPGERISAGLRIVLREES